MALRLNAARVVLRAALALALTAGAVPSGTSRVGVVSFRQLAIPGEVPAHLCTALVQDGQGFLWIGTQGGLVRFDGSQFKVFRSDPDDSLTLGGSYVRSLLAGSDGRLWVGTFSGGLSVYDPASERFTRYRHSPEDPASLSHNRVEGLAEDRSGRIWAATDEGLDRLDPKTRRIEHFKHDPADPRSLADNRTRAVLVDRDGRLWVGTRDGLQVWRGAARGFERIASEPGRPWRTPGSTRPSIPAATAGWGSRPEIPRPFSSHGPDDRLPRCRPAAPSS